VQSRLSYLLPASGSYRVILQYELTILGREDAGDRKYFSANLFETIVGLMISEAAISRSEYSFTSRSLSVDQW
jgi:hypothetical protein